MFDQGREGSFQLDVLTGQVDSKLYYNLGFLRLITSGSVRIVPRREGQLCGAGEVSGQLNKLSSWCGCSQHNQASQLSDII